jgi:hypothetical protein
MRSISFRFRPEVSRERQQKVLAQLNGSAWPAVQQAGYVNPNAHLPALQRMGYAYLAEDADPDTLAEAIAQLPEVETAQPAPQRRLR